MTDPIQSTKYLQEGTNFIPADMSLIYPEGTLFYEAHPDGSFTLADPQPEVDRQVPMTAEAMIASATKFMEHHGYTVIAPDAVPASPVPDHAKFLLEKLRVYVAGNMNSHESIAEASRRIAEISALF